EVATRARRVGFASHAKCLDVDVRHEKHIGEGVAAGREGVARGIALHRPLHFADLSRAEKRPDVVELEWVCVDDHEAIPRLALEYFVPSGDISIHPKPRRALRLGWNGRVVRECFEERIRPAVRSAPRRLACAARPLDDDDHVRSNAMSGRSRRATASGSTVAIPTIPATRNGPTQPEPRSSATPATTGPMDPIPNPATACTAC